MSYSFLAIKILHERPAVMHQVQLNQLILEILPGGVIKTSEHLRYQVADEFASRSPQSLRRAPPVKGFLSATESLPASLCDGRSGLSTLERSTV